uniref:DUF5648 domain-containing protein n=1 Tax=Eubacterium cellulosolvens (strain ATCC 43171 / JCM 9499 / 6) TaxID=633697 RepID=I5AWJ8_EUBC6
MKRKTVAIVLATAVGVMVGIGGSTFYADQLSNVDYTDAVSELQNADTEKAYASEDVDQTEADGKRAVFVKSEVDQEIENAVRAKEESLAEKVDVDAAERASKAKLRKADYDSKYAAYQDLIIRYLKMIVLILHEQKRMRNTRLQKKRRKSARAKAERAAQKMKTAEDHISKAKKNYANALSSVKDAEEAYKTVIDNIDIVYRLYYAPTKEHLFTTDANERRVLVSKHGWIDENVAWVSLKNGSPVFLFGPELVILYLRENETRTKNERTQSASGLRLL